MPLQSGLLHHPKESEVAIIKATQQPALRFAGCCSGAQTQRSIACQRLSFILCVYSVCLFRAWRDSMRCVYVAWKVRSVTFSFRVWGSVPQMLLIVFDCIYFAYEEISRSCSIIFGTFVSHVKNLDYSTLEKQTRGNEASLHASCTFFFLNCLWMTASWYKPPFFFSFAPRSLAPFRLVQVHLG